MVNIYIHTLTHFYQGSVLYMLGADCTRRQLILEGGKYWRKYDILFLQSKLFLFSTSVLAGSNHSL